MNGNDALQFDGVVRHPTGKRKTLGLAVPQDEPSLFAQATSVPIREVVGMFHADDPVTSQAAAVRAKPTVEELKQRILAVLAQYGPLTAVEMRWMPEFSNAGDYNVPRRCSDLLRERRVVRVGVRDGAHLLDVAP